MSFRPKRRLETPRLRLRPASLDDAAAIFDGYGQDPDVSRYTAWSPHDSVDVTREFLREVVDAWTGGRRFCWAIDELPAEDLVGCIEARVENGSAELGYVLRQSIWGRGIGSEACALLVQSLLDDPAVERVCASCHVDNTASARVLEKAGLRREGRVPSPLPFPNLAGDNHDVYVYGITR